MFTSLVYILRVTYLSLSLVSDRNGWRPPAKEMAGNTRSPLWFGGNWWSKGGKGCS